MFKQLSIVGLFMIAALQSTWGQDTTKQVVALSLEQAQAYAVQNSPVLKNANLDLEIAKKKIWETTAIGLPQVNAKVAGSYQIEMSPTIEMFSGLTNLGPWMYAVDQALFGVNGKIPKPEPTEPVSDFDQRWNVTLDVTVSQLLFSGSYLVGLQTTKVFKSLSEIAITKSKNDLQESVSNAYHLVLVMQENKLIMDSLAKKMERIVAEMEAMRKSGFVDETAVDQLKLTANTVKNAATLMSNQVEVSKNLLRLQLGLDMNQQIELTDSLDALIAQSINLQLIVGDYNVNSNSDFQLLETNVKLRELNLKLQKAAFLPDIAAFYQYEKSFNDKAFSFNPPQLAGVSMSIPIFSSGMRCSRVKQARMELDKAENTKYNVSNSLQLGYSDARTSYSNAINKLDSNKESMELARKIYDRTAIKLKNGMASSMELMQAQTQFLQAQATYYSTVIELVNAKNKLEKLSR